MEWSKKDDLVAEQALKHLRTYAPLFQVFVCMVFSCVV